MCIQNRKAKTYDAGLSAERCAANYIQQGGGEILGRRVRNSQGEIDVVSVMHGVISFTEVKHRVSFNDALRAVSQKAWSRISRAAESFMAARPDLDGLDWRYDLIVQNAEGNIMRIEDAWRPGFD